MFITIPAEKIKNNRNHARSSNAFTLQTVDCSPLNPFPDGFRSSVAKSAVLPQNRDIWELFAGGWFFPHILELWHIAETVIDWNSCTEIFYNLPVIKLCEIMSFVKEELLY